MDVTCINSYLGTSHDQTFQWSATQLHKIALSAPRLGLLTDRTATAFKCSRTTAVLKFMAINNLNQLLIIKRRSWFLILVTDQFSKLVETIPSLKISATTTVKIFVENWTMVYNPPPLLLYDNGLSFSLYSTSIFAGFLARRSYSQRRTVHSIKDSRSDSPESFLETVVMHITSLTTRENGTYTRTPWGMHTICW